MKRLFSISSRLNKKCIFMLSNAMHSKIKILRKFRLHPYNMVNIIAKELIKINQKFYY